MTKEQLSHNKYLELLKNEKFLQWRFFPDADTDAFWQEQQQEHPGLKDEIALADQYLKRHAFKKNTLSPANKQILLARIKENLNRHKKQYSSNRWMKYAAAACITLAIVGGMFFLNRDNSDTEQVREIIIGSLLDSEDIQLVTNNETKFFKENISVKIDAVGDVEIQEHNQQKKDMLVARNAINKLIVPFGKRSKIMLSDGTNVWLNSGSLLEFPSVFSGNNREIHLVSGEMFLEVATDKSRPFRVKTPDFQVEVLGTQFNISAYSDAPKSVVLVEGSVSLQSGSNNTILLKPSEQAIFSENGTFYTQKVDVNRFISWRDGYLEFEETPVSEALKRFERYYNLSFNYEQAPNLRHITCRGKLQLSDNIDNVMNSIAFLSSSDYKRVDNIIYITGKTDMPMEK